MSQRNGDESGKKAKAKIYEFRSLLTAFMVNNSIHREHGMTWKQQQHEERVATTRKWCLFVNNTLQSNVRMEQWQCVIKKFVREFLLTKHRTTKLGDCETEQNRNGEQESSAKNEQQHDPNRCETWLPFKWDCWTFVCFEIHFHFTTNITWSIHKSALDALQTNDNVTRILLFLVRVSLFNLGQN